MASLSVYMNGSLLCVRRAITDLKCVERVIKEKKRKKKEWETKNKLNIGTSSVAFVCLAICYNDKTTEISVDCQQFQYFKVRGQQTMDYERTSATC